MEGSIVEERVELMVSADEKNVELRAAHFIRPSIAINSIDGNGTPITNLPRHCLSSLPTTFEPKNWPIKVNFLGWRCPQKDWKYWVLKMASLHESTWKKVGIFEAIMNSMYKIKKDKNLVFGVAERWCHETKSFIFPWGEATVTLEDTMILGGFSVLGSPVFAPIETEEMEETLEKLNNARKEMIKSTYKKATHSLWMKKFMNSGSEIEHEAFLALWLSRFVLPSYYDVVANSVFPIAIHLATGTRIALGPAVLARIYRDLTFLNQKIVVASTELDSSCDDVITLWSPLTLVHVWVWERFSDLRPKPKLIENGKPRLALWHELECKVQDVRLVLDSAKERFTWRPYVNDAKFYGDTGVWVRIGSSLDDKLLSFARCLRASELVGLDCIEQYLPHRVALQFGMDQDVPASVPRSNNSPEIAWSDYNNSFGGEKLYIPSKLFEADVTARYLIWWKQSMLTLHEESKNVFTSVKKTPKSSKQSNKDDTYSGFKKMPKNLSRSRRLLKLKKKGDNASSDHGSPLKRSKQLAPHPKWKKEVCNASFVARRSSTPSEFVRKSSNGSAYGSKISIEIKDDTSSFPPGFTPKSSIAEDKVAVNHSASNPGCVSLDFDDEDQLTKAKILLKSNNKFDNSNNKYALENSSGQCKSFSCSVADNEVPRCEPITKLGAEEAANEASMVAAIDSNGEGPTVEELANNLKARIRRLERLVAEVKAAREVKSVTEAGVILD